MAEAKWLILSALAMEAEAVENVLSPRDGVEVKIIGPRGVGLRDEMLVGCRGVILAGLAGGLAPTLKIGDIVCSSPEPKDWPGLPFRWGEIYSSDRVIETPERKAHLFGKSGALAVDMESGIVQARAKGAGVPLLVIRAISDGAGEAVSAELLSWLDAEGRPRAAAVIGGILRHPLLVPQAIRLGKQSNLAAKNLARAVRQTLDALIAWPAGAARDQ